MIRATVWLLTLSLLGGCASVPMLMEPMPQPSQSGTSPVPRFEVFEAVLSASGTYQNPFTEVRVTVTFTRPDGRELSVEAFHDGGTTWRARIAPDLVGRWTYRTAASVRTDAGLDGMTGTFECVGSTSKGFIRPDPAVKYWFAFSDGTPFFGIGDTAYGLTSGVTDSQLLSYLDKRSSQGFNFIRLFASGSPFPERRLVPAEESWPWGGTPESPDYDRVNPRYFQRLDRLMGELARRDMYAEVLVFNYYSMPFIAPAERTPAREELWVREVIARLAAYRSVFLWTVTNEYETYPAGKYLYDGASDDDWAKRMGALFGRLDPQGHPATAHNFTFDANGGIGGRFGAGGELAILTHQSWGDATWRKQYLDGNAAGIERAIAVDRVFGKPVINTENGYEWLEAHSNFNQQSVGTDKGRRAAWRVFMAGGAAYAAGFGGTWMGTDEYRWKGDGPLRFRLQDMGLAAQIGHLRSFIDATDYMAMSPAPDCVDEPNLCLAARTREYVAYAPGGGPLVIDLSTEAGRIFAATSYNPRTGRTRKLRAVKGGSVVTFHGARSQDWALRLRALGDTDARPVR